MAFTKIEFDHPINASLQINDTIYVANELTGGTVSPPQKAGEVTEIGSHYIIINKHPSAFPEITIAPPKNNFILFAKDIQVNESSLKGYYADVTFKNSSKTKSELFAVGSEVALSSK